MKPADGSSTRRREATVIRLGGVAGLVTFGLHIVINEVLITVRSRVGGLNALASGDLSANAIGHGLRYPAFLCLAIFAVGLYVLTGRGMSFATNPWGILGLFGAAAQITTGVIANTIQTTALMSSANVSGQSEHSALLWDLGSVLFAVEPIWAGLMFVGFSVAGWQSATLPKWLAIPALLCAALNVTVAVSIVWVMTGHPAAELLRWARSILGLIWFLSACVVLVRRASPTGPVTRMTVPS
jgi:hypothetical protein